MSPKPRCIAAFAALALACCARALDINYVNKGTDNAFAPTENDTVIDLAAANSAAWDSVPTTPGNGVYDEDKWAVVFKFNSVNIPANVTVRFLNNASHAPVVWLVDGDVKIDGTVDLSGNSVIPINGGWRTGVYSEPGPGGFSGGIGNLDGSISGSGGFGPGGGTRNGGGGFGVNGALGDIGSAWWQDPAEAGGKAYGDSQMLRLTGGSGGGGDTSILYGTGNYGGGGGGAILIAASGKIQINGRLLANGGSVAYPEQAINAGLRSGAGSGGTIRLVSERLSGTGIVAAGGGSAAGSFPRPGGSGRIRLEANLALAQWSVIPPTPLLRPDSPVRLWPDETTPSARIVSVGTETTPPNLNGRIQLAVPDVTLRTTSTEHPIVVETRNLPDNTEVIVRIVPATGSPLEVLASLTSRNGVVATWTATNNVPPGMFVAQVRAKAK